MPSVRGKASSQQTEASLDQAVSEILFTTSRRLADLDPIAASHFLGSFRLITRSTIWHSDDRSSPSVNDCPSINSRQPVMQKVKRNRRTSLWKSLTIAHVFLATFQMLSQIERLTLFQTLGSHWPFPFGNIRSHGSTMGRRSGGLVGTMCTAVDQRVLAPRALSEMP